jgi:Tat protein translocase TatB subunit
MQFIGIGIWELLLILAVTVLVVGPDRLPEVAAQLAKWIRQARAYANVVAKDFNAVVGDLEKEVGASRADLKEIESVLRRDGRSVMDELDKAGKDLKDASDLEAAAGTSRIEIGTGNGAANGAITNGTDVPDEDSTAIKERRMAEEMSQAPAPESERAQAAPSDDEWFVPTSSRRRRRSNGDGP